MNVERGREETNNRTQSYFFPYSQFFLFTLQLVSFSSDSFFSSIFDLYDSGVHSAARKSQALAMLDHLKKLKLCVSQTQIDRFMRQHKARVIHRRYRMSKVVRVIMGYWDYHEICLQFLNRC